MYQNRRANTRTSIPIDVTLRYGESYFLPGKVRDMSARDAFVETDAILLAPGVALHMDVALDAANPATRYRLPVRVVRVDQDGVGLVFEYQNHWAYTAMGDRERSAWN